MTTTQTNAKVGFDQGAESFYIANGGTQRVESGGAINIESGGALNFADGGENNVESGGVLNIKSGGTLDVESGGVLDINGQGNVKSGGALDVKSGGEIDIESGGALKIAGTDKTAILAAAVAAPVAGAAASYKIARGVASITGSGTVVTGLTTVVAITATAQDDLDGDALAGVSASIGDQAGAPAAGSVYLKAWKVTTGGVAGNPTLIAATAAKNINWIAVGT